MIMLIWLNWFVLIVSIERRKKKVLFNVQSDNLATNGIYFDESLLIWYSLDFLLLLWLYMGSLSRTNRKNKPTQCIVYKPIWTITPKNWFKNSHFVTIVLFVLWFQTQILFINLTTHFFFVYRRGYSPKMYQQWLLFDKN